MVNTKLLTWDWKYGRLASAWHYAYDVIEIRVHNNKKNHGSYK